jgi:L-2-hydroxyglutarate oxidase LhgO
MLYVGAALISQAHAFVLNSPTCGVGMPPRALTMMSGATQGHVHGEGGAYVGGYWVDLAECPEKFNIKGGSNERVPNTPCPRSRTRHSAANEDGTYDVAIIGSGCIGAAVARELSKTTASVIMIEAADDVCQGATKGNSGIVHAGFDDTPGSVRAELCWKGNQMFPQLDRELHFGYQLTGSLVCARGEEEEKHLEELFQRGQTNGVKNLRVVKNDELKKMEPHLDQACTAALHSPDAGTLIPYEYTIALAENAADNGVEVRIRREVRAIERVEASAGKASLFELKIDHWEPNEYLESRNPLHNLATQAAAWSGKAHEQLGKYFGGEQEGGPWENHPELVKGSQKVNVEDMKVGGSGSKRAMDGRVVNTEKVRARYVINCAGGASDKIARMVGDESFTIKPRLGEYILLKKSSGSVCNHTLFPCPGKYGKGVLVQKTLWGNLILGPTARDVHEWKDPDVDPDSKEDVMQQILSACKRLVPGFDTDDAFHSFSGARAKSTRGDWIIERCFSEGAPDGDFIHVAGIDSPGIAGSPAIALKAVELLKEAGFRAEADPSFNPLRAPIIVPKNGDEGLVYTPDDKKEVNAAGAAASANVVCKCEKVTEQEVIESCRRSLPVDSTQSIRKRTRAGMGGCQGKPWNYGCECRVAQVVGSQTDLANAAVGRRPWSATSLFKRRWLNADDKAELERLAAVDALAAQGIVAGSTAAANEKAFEQVEQALPLTVDNLHPELAKTESETTQETEQTN